MFRVTEVYTSICGEGVQVGRPAVFCRFSGCNLWSGKEEDRGQARCTFCDTNFADITGPHGGRYDEQQLSELIENLWSAEFKGRQEPFVVFTGGEPALQLNDKLLDLMKAKGFFTAIETNGTRPLPQGLDWICVSPKANNDLVVRKGNELKLVWPQQGIDPENLLALDFDHFFIQPRATKFLERAYWQEALQYVRSHSTWRLSIQMHKVLGIP